MHRYIYLHIYIANCVTILTFFSKTFSNLTIRLNFYYLDNPKTVKYVLKQLDGEKYKCPHRNADHSSGEEDYLPVDLTDHSRVSKVVEADNRNFSR